MSKKFFKFFGLFFIAILELAVLTSCASKEEFKVEFMVQDNANAWTVFKEEKVVEGEVKLLEAPKKTYYTFAGWFSEEALTTKFEGKDIKANTKAYAKYTPNQVKITINGKDEGTKNLIDVVNSVYNPGEGLKFNGWYKDSACKVSWDGKEDVSELYANSVAVVTYNNGYEDLTIEYVEPGTVVEHPATRVVEETTFEAKYILKDYMSKKNISYVDEAGVAIDFAKPVNKSMTVKVLWNSEIPANCYVKNEQTGNYYIDFKTQDTLGKAPVISILSDVTITTAAGKAADKEVEQNIHVEAFTSSTNNLIASGVKKVIIGEGIKSIKGLSTKGACSVEEVVIPSTTEIIDNSFNNMPLVKNFNIPEGVKIILDSFWGKLSYDYKTANLGTPYEGEITIPSSVVNMAMVPNNLKFAEGSTFVKENEYIFQNTTKGKVLISDPNAYAQIVGGTAKADNIKVPECDGIQAGTYTTMFNYLHLPQSFKFVNYNESLQDYKFYAYEPGSENSATSNMLFDKTAKDFSATMCSEAYSLSKYLDGPVSMGVRIAAGRVIFATKELPVELADTAFTTDSTGYSIMNGKYSPMITIKKGEGQEDKKILNPAVILSTDGVKAHFTLSYPGFTTSNLVLEGEQLKNLTAESVRDQLIGELGLTEQQIADIQKCKVIVKQNNKAVELGTVTETSYYTVEILMISISGDWRLSADGDYDDSVDPSKYTQAIASSQMYQVFATAVVTDLTNVTKETILAALLDGATKLVVVNGLSSATEEQVKANLKWSYDNATSIKIIVNGEEVTDFSKVDFNSGLVSIDVQCQFKEYGA